MNDDERRSAAAQDAAKTMDAFDDPAVIDAYDDAARALYRFAVLLKEHGMSPLMVLSQTQATTAAAFIKLIDES